MMLRLLIFLSLLMLSLQIVTLSNPTNIADVQFGIKSLEFSKVSVQNYDGLLKSSFDLQLNNQSNQKLLLVVGVLDINNLGCESWKIDADQKNKGQIKVLQRISETTFEWRIKIAYIAFVPSALKNIDFYGLNVIQQKIHLQQINKQNQQQVEQRTKQIFKIQLFKNKKQNSILVTTYINGITFQSQNLIKHHGFLSLKCILINQTNVELNIKYSKRNNIKQISLSILVLDLLQFSDILFSTYDYKSITFASTQNFQYKLLDNQQLLGISALQVKYSFFSHLNFEDGSNKSNIYTKATYEILRFHKKEFEDSNFNKLTDKYEQIDRNDIDFLSYRPDEYDASQSGPIRLLDGCTVFSCPDTFPHAYQCCQKDGRTRIATCDPGYYKKDNGQDKPKTCEPCGATLNCATCSYPNSCSTCPSGMITNVLSQYSVGCTCAAGSFIIVSGGSASCGTCVAAIPDCAICAINSGVTYCASCNKGFYLLANSLSCGACAIGCQVCTGPTVCTTCATSFILNAGVCECQTSALLYFTPNTCTSCSTINPKCISCTSNAPLTTTCTSCVSGYYPSGISCLACSLHCTTCTSSTNCVLCGPTFIVVLGACACNNNIGLFLSVTGSSCLLCSDIVLLCVACTTTTPTQCMTCSSGYYVSTTGTTCIACSSHCLSCTSNLVCTVCAPTFVLDTVSKTCSCPSGYLLDIAVNECLICGNIISNCQTCVPSLSSSSGFDCQTCSPSFYPMPLLSTTATSCEPCNPICATCDNSATCLTCILGFSDLDHDGICTCDNCPACQLLASNCAICTLTQCTTCLPGYYLSAINQCTNCPISCATCTSPTSCDICASTFIPTVPAGGCTCNNHLNFFINSAGTQCIDCTTLFPHCLSCSTNAGQTTCTSCSSGYFVSGGSCLSCPSTCTNCLSTVSCQTCISNLAQMNGVCICDNTNQQFYQGGTCFTCSILIPSCSICANDTSAPNGYSCTTCNEGYYGSPALASTSCIGCPFPCATCTSNVNCLTCLDTFVIIGTICDCNAANDMYLNTNINECQPCSSIFSSCLECQFISPNVQCKKCATGTYLSAAFTCLPCPYGCDVCTSQVACTTCQGNLSPSVNQQCECTTSCLAYTAPSTCTNCVASATANLFSCLNCEPGFYPILDILCFACPSTCKTCSTYLNCQTCQPSFTLMLGACVCDSYKTQFLVGLICTQCGTSISNCKTCTQAVSGDPLTCNQCLKSFYLQSSTICTSCSTVGCLTCPSDICSQCQKGYSLSLVAPYCTQDPSTCTEINCIYCPVSNSICQNCLPGYYLEPITLFCKQCTLISNCQTCISHSICTSCALNYVLINNMCVCDERNGYFLDILVSTCILCGTANTLNCQYCTSNPIVYPLYGYGCLSCKKGYYLDSISGSCIQCLKGCSKCSSSSCCKCQQPNYVMVLGQCLCNSLLNLFDDGMGTNTCATCTPPSSNCMVCSDLTTCSICQPNFYLNPTNGNCEVIFCGDGLITPPEQCDAGALNGIGCSSICQVQFGYICNGVTNSVCTVDNRFIISITNIINSCNQIILTFLIDTFDPTYDSCDYSSFFYSIDGSPKVLKKWARNQNQITYTFGYTQNIQNEFVKIIFNPSTLCFAQASSMPLKEINFFIVPTNNQLAYYYPDIICGSQQSINNTVKVITYTSYAVMIVSALPCKIVGLELFGVLQLAFFSVGSLDSVNVLMAPMKALSMSNGLNIDLDSNEQRRLQQLSESQNSRLLQSTNLTPERVRSIGYKSNFLRNCNVMLFIVIAVMTISVVLYLLTYLCKGCAPTLYAVARRMIKEVLLTLILFNCFNFAYSAGLHFRYSSPDDSLYVLGTVAAVMTLVLQVAMAVGLLVTEDDGFGEYKDKLKQGTVNRAYFVVTIIYRMGIGYYMSIDNENEIATLIILLLSIFFLLYNLVNLPFTKAYHNYRANICHLTQFVCLFVVMYYRSMKSNTPSNQVATIFSPVYLQLACIAISLFVSLVVLIYEVYIWIKQCRKQNENKKTMNESVETVQKPFEQKKQYVTEDNAKLKESYEFASDLYE